MTLVGSRQNGSFKPSALAAHCARKKNINNHDLQTASATCFSQGSNRLLSFFSFLLFFFFKATVTFLWFWARACGAFYRVPVIRQTMHSKGQAKPKCVRRARRRGMNDSFTSSQWPVCLNTRLARALHVPPVSSPAA